MLNFYKFYNKTGLDHEEYDSLMNRFFLSPLDQLVALVSELKPIEHIIKKNPKYAYYYAFYVIKRRFIDAEQYIMKNDFWWKSYCKDFNI